MRYILNGLLVSSFLCISAFASEADETQTKFRKTKEFEGATYTFEKSLTPDGKIRETIKTGNGNVLSPQEAETLYEKSKAKKQSKLSQSVIEQLNSDSPKIELWVAFKTPEDDFKDEARTGFYQPETGWVINGRSLTAKQEMEELQKRSAIRAERRKNRAFLSEARMTAWAKRHGLEITNPILLAVNTDVNTIQINVTKQKLERIVQSAEKDDEIVFIDLYPGGGSAIANAMPYSHVDPRALSNSLFWGSNIGVFVTEWYGCANPWDFSSYTRLDGVTDAHGQYVLDVLRNVSPNAYMYCTGSPRLPTSTELNGSGSNPPVHIVNASFYWVTTANNYTTTDRDWDDYVYNNYVSIFGVAGNDGTSVGRVITPSRGYNVISVGASNHATATVANFSNYINPETGAAKPEFTAPGMGLCFKWGCGYDSYDGYSGYWGTSFAAPHAAGIAADYAGFWTGVRDAPFLMRSLLMATATIAETGNSNGGYDSTGVGGLSFLNNSNFGYVYFYLVDAPNNYFSSAAIHTMSPLIMT